MTNFDKIKQMSLEEFARFMIDDTTYVVDDLCDKESPKRVCVDCRFFDFDDCKYKLLEEWLEKEVKSNGL